MPTRTASPKQIAANKANGLKSTGPRTAEGKARVSANALKHGLRSERNPLDLANDMALPIEREEFLETLAAFTEDLAPVGPLETHFVERLAHITLRLRRAARMETAHLDISARKVFQTMGQHLPDEPPARDSWLVTLAFLQNPAALNLISAYESRLSRDFARTLTQLRQSQKLRNQTQQSTVATASDPCHPSDGVVATPNTGRAMQSAAQETAKQTHSNPQLLPPEQVAAPHTKDFEINNPSLSSSSNHHERA